MQRISVPFIYELGVSLQPLNNIKANDPVVNYLFDLFTAEKALDEFIFQSVYSPILRVCRLPGAELIAVIRAMMNNEDYTRTITAAESGALTRAFSNFKAVFSAEFATASVYLVTRRRGYDIAILIEQAEELFPEDLIKKIPSVKLDLREAGKCIAFDLGTAAGFHLLRALETVICCYWHVVMEGQPLPKNRNLGAYIREMETAKKGEGKVLVALKQIKDFHRNSLMHPEEVLDLDQAIGLLGIVQSAIVTMLPVIEAEDDGLKLLENSAAEKPNDISSIP